MADPREAILARIAVIAGTITGIKKVGRNIIQADDNATALPAIYVLEGDEVADARDPAGRPALAPRRVEMTPQVVIVCGTPSESLGPQINELRRLLIKAILSDATLQGMSLNGHSLRYEGSETDLGFGRKMFGLMAAKFTITYLLEPNKL